MSSLSATHAAQPAWLDPRVLQALADRQAGPAPAPGMAAKPFHVWTEGVPPVSQALLDEVAAYMDATPTVPMDYAPHREHGQAMLVRYGADQQLGWLTAAGGEPRPLPRLPGDVLHAEVQPGGDVIAATVEDPTGDVHLYLVNGEDVTRVLPGPGLRGIGAWSPSGKELLVTSRLDDNVRETAIYRVPVQDPERPVLLTTLNNGSALQSNCWNPIEYLPRAGYGAGATAWHGNDIYVAERIANNVEVQVWKIDAVSGDKEIVLPGRVDGMPVCYDNLHATDRGLFLTTERESAYYAIAFYDFEAGTFNYLNDLDTDSFEVSEAGKIAAVCFENGERKLKLYDAATRQEILLPPGIPADPGRVCWHPDGHQLSVTTLSSERATDAYVLDTRVLQEPATLWAQTQMAVPVDHGPPTLHTVEFFSESTQQMVTQHLLVHLPPGDPPPGGFPVQVAFHGGPDSLATSAYLNHRRALLDRGIAVIEDNYPGSAGWGIKYQRLDNVSQSFGNPRGWLVAAEGAAAVFNDFVRDHPALNAERAMAWGHSAGAYLVNTLLTMFEAADQTKPHLRGAFVSAGMSHMAAWFAQSQPRYTSGREPEYGSSRVLAELQFQHEIAPAGRVDRIDVPVFYKVGGTDFNVPAAQGEEMHRLLAERGADVRLIGSDRQAHRWDESCDDARYANAAEIAFTCEVLGVAL
jgi:dipeptidyl aminopeptidase/acylaminoacyl peptidase